MRPVLLSISALLLATAAGPAPALTQAPDANAAASAEAPALAEPAALEGAAAAGAQPEPSGGSALPQRAPQARTLRPYWHVFAAFAVTWILLFGYALSVGRRFARLDEEVQRLRGMQ